MKNPLSLGCACSTCPFAVNGLPNRPVWGEGPATPVGILVGETPSLEDASASRPMVGQVGPALGEALAEAGLDRRDLYLCNAILCRPSKEALKEQKLFGEAVKCCRPALAEQLSQFPATVPVFGMGKWAQRALMKRQLNIKTARGFIRWDWSGLP